MSGPLFSIFPQGSPRKHDFAKFPQGSTRKHNFVSSASYLMPHPMIPSTNNQIKTVSRINRSLDLVAPALMRFMPSTRTFCQRVWYVSSSVRFGRGSSVILLGSVFLADAVRIQSVADKNQRNLPGAMKEALATVKQQNLVAYAVHGSRQQGKQFAYVPNKNCFFVPMPEAPKSDDSIPDVNYEKKAVDSARVEMTYTSSTGLLTLVCCMPEDVAKLDNLVRTNYLNTLYIPENREKSEDDVRNRLTFVTVPIESANRGPIALYTHLVMKYLTARNLMSETDRDVITCM